MAPLDHHSMLGNQRERPLLQLKLGAFFDADVRLFGSAAESSKHGNVGIEPQPIIAPMAGSDHSSIKIEDALQFRAVECRNGTPIPRMRKRRDHAQALLTFGLWLAAGTKLRDFATQFLYLVLKLGQPGPAWIAILAARRAIRNEARAVMHRVDRYRPCRNPDDGALRRHILGYNRIGSDLGALADLDRARVPGRQTRSTTPEHRVGWRLPPTPVEGLVPPSVTFW